MTRASLRLRSTAVDWSVPRVTALAVLRKEKLLTQRELASAAGVTIATVSYAESGVTKPKILTILKIRMALGVRPKDVDEFRRALDLPNQRAWGQTRAMAPGRLQAFFTRDDRRHEGPRLDPSPLPALPPDVSPPARARRAADHPMRTCARSSTTLPRWGQADGTRR